MSQFVLFLATVGSPSSFSICSFSKDHHLMVETGFENRTVRVGSAGVSHGSWYQSWGPILPFDSHPIFNVIPKVTIIIAFVRISDHKITFYLYKILISFSFIFQITATNLHKFRYTLRGGRCTLLNVCPLLGYLIKSETSNLQLFIVVNAVATNKPYTIVRAIVHRAN